MRHVDWDIVKCLVIAGPGFAKDQFLEFLTAEAVKRDLKCAMCFTHPIEGVTESPAMRAWKSRLDDTCAGHSRRTSATSWWRRRPQPSSIR